MEHEQYGDEDSNPFNNGWMKIKKEIQDFDEMDEYSMKIDPGDETSDRFEELMSLSKEDLVGRILNMEDEIRNLRDIRNGLDLSAKDITTGCADLRKVVTSLTSIIKEYQRSRSPLSLASSGPSSKHTPNVSAMHTSRGASHVPSNSASSRQSNATSSATPRHMPTSTPSNTSSNVRSCNVSSAPPPPPPPPANQQVSAFTTNKDSGSSVTSQQTFSITRTTNVVIKTEIPSPPPELNSVPPAITHPGNANPHRNPSDVPYQQPRPQRTRASTGPTPIVTMPPTTRSNPMMNAADIQTFPARKRPRMNTPMPYSTRQVPHARGSVNAVRAEMPYHMVRPKGPNQHVQPQNMYMAQGAKVNTQQMGRGQYTTQVKQQQQPIVTSPVHSVPGMVRNTRQHPQASVVPPQQHNIVTTQSSSTATPTSSSSACSPVNTLLGNIKVPSCLSLSIVNPKAAAAQKLGKSNAEKTQSSQTASSAQNRSSEERNLVDGDVMDGGNRNTSYEDDDEEDEGDFDEIAVLIPDSNVDGEGDSKQSGSAKDDSSQKIVQPYYANNSEYVLEEVDDMYSDEQDTKMYLAEDVSLPREMVNSCIQQGDTPVKLTRHLMSALFPDMREMASAITTADITKNIQPALPENKMKAIIDFVQKSFPDCKRSSILMAMNVRCNEAKVLVSRNSQRRT